MRHLEISGAPFAYQQHLASGQHWGCVRLLNQRTTMELDVNDDDNCAVSDRSDPSDPTDDGSDSDDKIRINDTDKLLFDVIPKLALLLGAAVIQYADPLYNKTPYHTSALSGQGWVEELLDGHPERIRCELGICKHVFQGLITALLGVRLQALCHVTLEEQLAIFLYTCVTGLSTRHIDERFQRSNDTISKYFRKILVAFSSVPFYTNNVSLPKVSDPVPAHIHNNPKFFLFFGDAVGAMDGTHINCAPTAAERQASWNHKGGVTQNCLAACMFDLQFVYMYSGWEGLAADSAMYHDAHLTELSVIPGKYYLSSGALQPSDY
jgi:hypothetical protein